MQKPKALSKSTRCNWHGVQEDGIDFFEGFRQGETGVWPSDFMLILLGLWWVVPPSCHLRSSSKTSVGQRMQRNSLNGWRWEPNMLALIGLPKWHDAGLGWGWKKNLQFTQVYIYIDYTFKYIYIYSWSDTCMYMTTCRHDNSESREFLHAHNVPLEFPFGLCGTHRSPWRHFGSGSHDGMCGAAHVKCQCVTLAFDGHVALERQSLGGIRCGQDTCAHWIRISTMLVLSIIWILLNINLPVSVMRLFYL